MTESGARPFRPHAGEVPSEGLDDGARMRPTLPDWGDEPASREDLGDNGGSKGARGGLLRGTVAVLALAVFGGVVWYAYQWGVGDQQVVELPVVPAEPGPEKVKPEDPGGMQIPYQENLVLNRDSEPEATRVERLLPPPEVPLPAVLPAQEPAPDPVEETPVEETSVEETSVEELAQTVIEDLAPAAAEAIPPPPAESAAPAAPAAETQAASGSAGGAEAPAIPTAQPQVAELVGAFALQLASLKSSDAAEQEWTRLQKLFPDILAGLSLFVMAAEVEGVGQVYRLQIGTFQTHSTAADLCAQLKAKGQDCFIVRR